MKDEEKTPEQMVDEAVRELCLGERITLGLILLLRCTKKHGGELGVGANFDVLRASVPTDKHLTEVDRATLEALGWWETSRGEYRISVKE